MVDITSKDVSSRIAIAAGEVRTTQEVLDLLRENGMPKGDAIAVARLAGIMAAKKTSELIPLCHPLPLSHVGVEISPTRTGYAIEGTARTAAPTGVEMEALTAVAVAALTIYDMVKAVDKAMVIGEICLWSKTGGKSGPYQRPGGRKRKRRATDSR